MDELITLKVPNTCVTLDAHRVRLVFRLDGVALRWGVDGVVEGSCVFDSCVFGVVELGWCD